MKTKKYKKISEGNGYKYHETNYSIIVGKYLEEDYDIEIKVGKLRPGRLEVTIKGFCGDESDMILAAMELAETPLEDREEEKKFYLKHRYLRSTSGNILYFSIYIEYDFSILTYRRHSSETKQQFSLKEIEEIKKKFDTDLKDFELVEVEDVD